MIYKRAMIEPSKVNIHSPLFVFRIVGIDLKKIDSRLYHTKNS